MLPPPRKDVALIRLFSLSKNIFFLFIEWRKCHSVCIAYKKDIWKFVKQMLPPSNKDVASIRHFILIKIFLSLNRGQKMSLSLYCIQARYLEVCRTNAPSTQERCNLNNTLFWSQNIFFLFIEWRKCHSVCIAYKKDIWKFVKQMLPPSKKDVASIRHFILIKIFLPLNRGPKMSLIRYCIQA